MRPCPVCEQLQRNHIFSMGYKVPDGWPLPHEINWYTCFDCDMLYGDGDFDQAMLDEFYTKYYGYGVDSPENQARLKGDAEMMVSFLKRDSVIVDFGGAGTDGRSLIQEILMGQGFKNVYCVGPNEPIPQAHVIYASHVLEHIYDLPRVMERLVNSLSDDGLLIVDVPDSAGIVNRWKAPILDFNTKHINHFTLRNLLDLGHRYSLEGLGFKWYDLIKDAPCIQIHFKRLDIAQESSDHIFERMFAKVCMLREKLTEPMNIWGLGDVVWHLMASEGVDHDMLLDFIDNDPAMVGQTYYGKPILQRPTNNSPILVIAQGQRSRLLAHIKSLNLPNEIVEI